MIRFCRPLSSKVDRVLRQAGFDLLYPVQIEVQSKLETNPNANIVVKSATGSGKTLAYLIPVLEEILCKPYSEGTGRVS